jgi:integrase
MIIRKTFPQVYRFTRKNGSAYWHGAARSAKWHMNERRTFATEKDALDWARGIEQNITKHGGQTDVPDDKVVMADAYAKLIDRLTPYSKTPEEAVGFFLVHLGTEATRQAKPFIRTLVDKWQEFKKADTTLSKRTLTEIRSYARFIKRKWGDLKPDDAKRNDIDLLLKGLRISNTTRRKYLLYVRMFFSWVKDEGHLSQNPTDGIFYKPDDFNGDFYTPEVTKRLLRYVVEHEKDLIGYYALLTFAGLRPSEGARVQWQDYNSKTNELYVRKGKTHARHIILKPVAVAWMTFHRENTPKDAPFISLLSLGNREKEIRTAVLNGKWVQDGLRHGFGTYFKALTKSIAEVADYMGNSPDIVKRHYARTVPKEDCDAFWGLTPAVVSANEQERGDAAVAPDKADKPTPAIKSSDCVIKNASVQIASPVKKTEMHFVPMNTGENALP